MITNTMSVMNPLPFKFIIFMLCLVSLVCGEHEIMCIEREREALLQFKAAIYDHNGMLSSWSSADCCQWEGIRCSNLTGHVLMLHLHAIDGVVLRRYLSGEIHKSLAELTQLLYLNLGDNYFPGSHIPEFLGSLRNLRYLDLSSCYFHGKIPTQLGSLSHLKYLNLAQNYYLGGSIPRQLENLSKLQHLDLKHNSIEGNIPSQLGNLTNLEYLDLKHNSIEGSIPSQLGKLSNLRYFDLKHNSIEGNIPSQLGNLSNLQYLDLNGNYFEGSIPSQLGNLSNLQELYLGGFHGALKMNHGDQWLSSLISLTHLSLVSISDLNSSQSRLQRIAKLPKLRELSINNCGLSDQYILSLKPSKFNFSTSLSVLDLYCNNFTSSTVFQWVSNITSHLVELDLSDNLLEAGSTSNHFVMAMNSLEHLDLSFNRLKGAVLKSFMNKCTLRSLNMYHNNLTEDIPSILHNLSSGCVSHSLQDLDLAYNQIIGSLPDLSVFSSLKILVLDGNQLSGKIPEGITLPSKLELLSIRSNSLEGGIPKSFGSTCTLESLDLSDNMLTEELTVIFNHLAGCAKYSLRKLNLSQNKINGALPNFLSMFPSLRKLFIDRNNLNGTISKDVQFPTDIEELDLSSNSLKGMITDYYFANMSKLKRLVLSDNSLTLAFTQNWVPSFQLNEIGLRSCNLGPAFPKWLQTQNDFNYLDISNASISDIVPKWFWAKLAFEERVGVDISNNNLKGMIPNFPLKNHYCSSLSLGSNQFEGPIPQFLRGYMILDLSKNKFSASDSLSFLCATGAVEILYQLDLSNNQLSGKIPDCWSHFKTLAYLNLSHNKFSGNIPISIGSLLELQALLLRSNNLTDEIPSSLRNCTELVMLDMAENRLSGPIPSWIGSKLQKLQILSLAGNRFSGCLPLQTCHLKSIQILDLSLNNLSGRIPKCIKNFTSMAQKTCSREYRGHTFVVNTTSEKLYHSYYLNAFLMWKGSKQMFMDNGLSLLKSIDLSSNHFSDEMPREIEYLLGLVSLNLSGNNLTGKIPSNIGKLTSLEFLDLSQNQLSGLIPSSITQIDRLTMLNVSHNHLSGMIPIGTQLQSFDASSYGDNDLCGLPLKNLCTDGKPVQEPINKLDDDEDLFFTREFYMSMTIGFVISFWGVFGSILIKRSWRHAYFKFLNKVWEAICVMAAVKVFKRRLRR